MSVYINVVDVILMFLKSFSCRVNLKKYVTVKHSDGVTDKHPVLETLTLPQDKVSEIAQEDAVVSAPELSDAGLPQNELESCIKD